MIKLSELTFDKSLDVLASLTMEINEITQDKELMKKVFSKVVVKEKVKEEDKNGLYYQIAINKFTSVFPMVIKKYKKNVLNIVAIMREEDLEEVKKLSLIEVINTFKTLASDKDFLDLLKSTVTSQ